jgi:hypothetical protein
LQEEGWDMDDIWEGVFNLPTCDNNKWTLDVDTQCLLQYLYDSSITKTYHLNESSLPDLDELQGVLEESITNDNDKGKMQQTALRLQEEGWELRWNVHITDEDNLGHHPFLSEQNGEVNFSDGVYVYGDDWHQATPYLYLPCFKGEDVFDDILEDLNME